MKIHSLIIDDFFSDYDNLEKEARKLNFKGIVNPVDGVFYPGIAEVDAVLSFDIYLILCNFFGSDVKLTHMPFFRMSKLGTTAPQLVHTDALMGQYTLIVYFNEAQSLQDGTTVYWHKSLIDKMPSRPDCVEVCAKDANVVGNWIPVNHCFMQKNRAFIFDSKLFHCGHPIGGFGKTKKDARLILGAFFNVV